MFAHIWVEPEAPNPNLPMRWCIECDKEEWEDGTVQPGWIRNAPCYEGERVYRHKARIYKHRCDEPCGLWVLDWGNVVVSADSQEECIRLMDTWAKPNEEVEAA